MKKLLALLLALVMVLSLVACGEDVEETTKRRRKNSSDDEETTEETVEEGIEPDEGYNADWEDDTEKSEQAEQETEPETPERNDQWMSAYTVFEELDVTVVDETGYSVTIGELKNTGYWLEAEVEIENNTNESISVSTVGSAVNGKSDTTSLYTSADAKTTIEDTISLYDYEDPDDVTRLSLLLSVTDADYDSTYFLVDIYPQGMDAYTHKTPKAAGKDILVNEDGVFAAIQSYSRNGDTFSINYLMLNDSEEAARISLDPVAYNDFGINDYISDVLLPGTYAEEKIESYEYEYLSKLGMKDITSVTFDVSVTNAEYQERFKEEITVYPEGKSNAKAFVYTPDSDDLVIAETDEVKFILTQVTEDEYSGTELLFVLENKTNGFVNVEATEIKINGKKLESGWLYCSVYEGRDTYDVLHLYNFQLEDLGITEVTSVKMLVSVKDNNYTEVYEETITITIS